MKPFIENVKNANPGKPLNEVDIIGKLNSNACHCKTCGTTAEMLLSTGFSVCKDCLSIFDEIGPMFSFDKVKQAIDSIPDTPIESKNEEVNETKEPVEAVEKKPLTKDDMIKENNQRIDKLKERIEKYVKKEDFNKCIELRDKIKSIEEENAKLAESDNDTIAVENSDGEENS
jgi:protein-arginine kinase activator protein McsA